MSAFKALNIESDEESDVEIDDTKEIQIEDALKLYQNALRYHAEGPASFDRAAEAYRQLFDSEIFKYPESQRELRRIELFGPIAEPEEYFLDDLEIGGPVITTGGLDTGPRKLPQILHLSHKNYAQFKMEHLSAQMDTLQVDLQLLLADASSALDHFVDALDKDDTDLDLWRRTASVGSLLNSKRVARFCLEAVLDGDDEGLSGVMSLPGLEDRLAGEQLRDLVRDLEDHLSLLQAPLPPGKRKVLSRILKQRLNTYQRITAHEQMLHDPREILTKQIQQPQRVDLKLPSSWAELGDLLLLHLMAEQHGTGPRAPASAISFDLTETAHHDEELVKDESIQPDSTTARLIVQGAMPTTAENEGLIHDITFPSTEIHNKDPEVDGLHGNDVRDTAVVTAVNARMMTLTSRKRSGDAAGMPDATDEGRARSKRIRARDSTTDAGDTKQALIDANIQWEYEQQLNEFQAADDWMFETVGNLFEKIGIVGFEIGKDIRQEIQSVEEDGDSPIEPSLATIIARPLHVARKTIYDFLSNFDDTVARSLLNGGDNVEIGLGGPSVTSNGGSLINGVGSRATVKQPLISNDKLPAFLRHVNNSWLLNHEIAWEWLLQLLHPGTLVRKTSTYMHSLWPDELKRIVVRMIVNFDENIYVHAKQAMEAVADKSRGQSNNHHFRSATEVVEVVQSLFELHLDIFTLIKQPNSGVDIATIADQNDRLQRWVDLARDTLHLHYAQLDSNGSEELSLRFMWAVTFYMSASDDVTQAHVIECMNDLRSSLQAAGEPVIHLQNNAIMPELSIAALDREISRLSTRDFFLKVTSQNNQDPVSIIENLEPLLESLNSATESVEEYLPEDAAHAQRVSPELVKFLQGSDISIRLLLWHQLREAYKSIDYQPMIVYCYLKTMRMVLDELKLTTTADLCSSERKVIVLTSLRLLQAMTAEILSILQASSQALECIDSKSLQTAVGLLGEILQLLQVFNVFEDSIRVGQSQPPTLQNDLPTLSFRSVTSTMHDLQVQVWMILYALLRETIEQNRELYPQPVEDRFEFLRCVHRNLGLRGICGASNRCFVRMLKEEFQRMTSIDGYDSEQAQVLYDLYGLNCFLKPSYELIEHKCTHDAFLDRGAAMQAIDLLIAQASKLPIKELIKHPLKDTIERVHGAAPRKKPTEAILKNREVYRAFLKSPIIPIDLFNCLKGEGNQLDSIAIPRDDALLTSKGWFFLMGHIALTKFRSQKRTAPAPTEDLDIAIAFFMQDLEYSMDNWETWFRVAQAYDSKIEESVVWSAEKLNSNMSELVLLQRSAIHCYIMASALAHRSASLVPETSDKLTELYYDFACRLYSSSREPFGMLPFAMDEGERFLTPALTGVLGKARSWEPLRVYTTWKLAKHFFLKAAPAKSKSWTLHFLLGKCLWKMHSASSQARAHDATPSGEAVLECFIRAIELIPDKKDSREKREPILEPHYKLASIVHKMVTRGTIGLPHAQEALSHTRYARTNSFPQARAEWIPYILSVFRNLRAADKSNWHHRIIARTAHVVYGEIPGTAAAATETADLGPDEHAGAAATKHELTQQLFTKTMVLQVWRPECERAGRHFVYTARYTRFFVKILEQLRDHTNLEALARRVRRRLHDVFEHGLVWQDICNAYLRLLRRHAELPEGLETATFSNIVHDDFLARKAALEKWMQSQEPGSSVTLDVLRDVQELKKINQGLMKPAVIDDMIGDAYAHLYSTVGKELWVNGGREKAEDDVRRQRMNLSHLMNVDSIVDGATSQPSMTGSNGAIDLPARRKIGVGRREVRSSAEACLQKAASIASPAVRTPGTNVKTLVSVVIDNSRAEGDAPPSADTSAPGSVHDSADDESELSELEEEGEGEDETRLSGEEATKRLLFPGLVQGRKQESDEEGRGSDLAEDGEEDEEAGEGAALSPGDEDDAGERTVEGDGAE
nr:histone transcription regulator 3 homolog [Quercus suber]